MKNGTGNGQYECAQMPDVLAEIQDKVFSEGNLTDIAPDERENIMSVVAKIEGSGVKMTCIAEKDYPQIIQVVRRAIATKRLTSDSPFDIYGQAVKKELQGQLRSANRHCDECLRQDCERRSKLTRQQIKEMSKIGAPLSSRGTKVAQQLPDEETPASPLADLKLSNERV